MKKLIMLALLGCVSATAETGSHYYPYDDCETTTHKMNLARKGVELRLATAQLIPAFVPGSYKGIWDLTSGYTLHLFPDKTAMLESWCDVCPARLVAVGEWAADQSSVRIDWKEQRFNAKEKELYVKSYGLCESLILYLLFDDKKSVREVYLVSKDQDGELIRNPIWRFKEYYDWKRTKDELKKANHSLEPTPGAVH